MNRFNSVVLDIDSTLSGVEGIDWLASLRGPKVAAAIAALTERAMQGKLPLEAVYGERLKTVKPTLAEVRELANVYIERLAPHAREAVNVLRSRQVEIVLVSGGLRQAVLPVAEEVGLAEDAVYAVSVFFDEAGKYEDFDTNSVLTRQNGKRKTVQSIGLKGPTLAVGDGMTDWEISPVVASFAAFTGFVRRAEVVQRAEHVLENFDQLSELVLT